MLRAGAGALFRSLSAVVAREPLAGTALRREGAPIWLLGPVGTRCLSGAGSKSGERQLYDVKWRDEFASLGDDPDETRQRMVEEDRRLRQSTTFTTPLRKTIFDEVVRNRKLFHKEDAPAVVDGNTIRRSQTASGAASWVVETPNGEQRVIASAEPDDFGDQFERIVDLKLDAQQDKAAILVADGRHAEAHTCVIKPVGVAASRGGVMAAGDELEAVERVQWLAGGQHVVYTRVGATGVPTEVWLHRVGTREAEDRQLYEEEYEGWHVHVGVTTDGTFVTITSLSKSGSEVHLLDARCADAAPVVVHERSPGLMYWVCHAHGRLIIMHNGAAGDEYRLSVCPVAPPSPSARLALPPAGRAAWAPLVHCDVGILEDIRVYGRHIVLSCREKGVPVLRVAPLSLLPPLDEEREDGDDDPRGGTPVSSLPRLPLPPWALHVTAGANLDFDTATHVCHASSPVHEEHELHFDLDAAELVFDSGATPAAAAAGLDGLAVERVQVPIKAEATQEDYLEMVYRLLPRDDADDFDVDARPSLIDGTDTIALALTLAHRPAALAAPLRAGGAAAVVMRAYGAYGLAADLSFSPDDLALLNRGVVIVTAHVRGGGEHGRAWHLAGTVHRKWAALFDYAAALNYVVDAGISVPGRIASDSFSAGALLAAQALVKVPDAFAAALFRRPFVTLLNSMTDPTLPMTAHEYDEWGDPASEDVVTMWAGISPHKQIAPARYPPVLVTTGTQDTRVEWWGPVKFAWRLRANQLAEEPILLSWGHDGHFCVTPNQVALEHTFLARHLGAEAVVADGSEEHKAAGG